MEFGYCHMSNMVLFINQMNFFAWGYEFTWIEFYF